MQQSRLWFTGIGGLLSAVGGLLTGISALSTGQTGLGWSQWAYVRPFNSSAERAAALPYWLHTYNHHRTHTALDGHPPISRITVNNAAGHYN